MERDKNAEGEDPDKFYADEADALENESAPKPGTRGRGKGKGRGRGKGKGRGRGRAKGEQGKQQDPTNQASGSEPPGAPEAEVWSPNVDETDRHEGRLVKSPPAKRSKTAQSPRTKAPASRKRAILKRANSQSPGSSAKKSNEATGEENQDSVPDKVP